MSSTPDPAAAFANKTILVTGGNAGIGAAIVRTLASTSPSARIYICSRRLSAAESLASEYPSADLRPLQLDLSSFDSVRACASKLQSSGTDIDILFLNAGIALIDPALTKEGYEERFGVNHMGHALLTQLLLPGMLRNAAAGRDVRIVANSSRAGENFLPPGGGLALARMREESPFSAMTLYGHSKLANILFMRKMAQLYPGITSTSTHPGTVKSDIWGKSKSRLWSAIFGPVVWLTGVTNEEGARALIWCAGAERQEGKGEMVKNGGFYHPVGKIQKRPESDQRLMDELWEYTESELARYGAPGWPKK